MHFIQKSPTTHHLSFMLLTTDNRFWECRARGLGGENDEVESTDRLGLHRPLCSSRVGKGKAHPYPFSSFAEVSAASKLTHGPHTEQHFRALI